VPLSRERQRRVAAALQQNLQQWLDQLAEIEHHAIPGNKHRILHLMANMEQARRAIDRIMSDDAGQGD
jgi:hypothetical protein